MDANGTRFHLVLGPADWGLRPGQSLAGRPDYSPEGTVTLRALPFTFPERVSEAPLTLSQRRGAASDRSGTWYWIGDDGLSLWVRGRSEREASRFWPRRVSESAPAALPVGTFAVCPPEEPSPPLPLRGLCVTTEHFLVVGVEGEFAGILVFDLYGGGSPLHHQWPVDAPFAPLDMACARDGGVWVLDAQHGALWSLDRWMRPRRLRALVPSVSAAPDDEGLFAPDPAAGPADPLANPPIGAETSAAVSFSFAIPLADVQAPVAIDSLADGSILVLNNSDDGAEVVRVSEDGAGGGRVSMAQALVDAGVSSPLLATGHDLAVVAEPRPSPPRGTALPDDVVARGTLYVTGPDGNQAFRGALTCSANSMTLVLDRAYLPMRRFGGRALVASGVSGEAAAYYDGPDVRFVPLVEQPRASFERETSLLLPPDGGAFDGREPACVWHRLLLDACIPPDCSINVETRSADDQRDLADRPWRPEPTPYRRSAGSELPTYGQSPGSTADAPGTWETLCQDAVGRWLQVRLTLRGPGRTTPRVRALRAYYPRFSYLAKYLPATYRDDPTSAAFLDRFLANVEGTFTDIEGRIAGADALFDVRTLPPEFLSWLATWFGADGFDPAWTPATRRLWLAHAIELYRTRGTRVGLVRALRMALDAAPDASLFDPACEPDATPGAFSVRVVEQFRRRFAPGITAGDPTDVLGPGSTTDTLQWSPAMGAEPLHQRWSDWLASRYASRSALDLAWGEASSAFATWLAPPLRLSPVRPVGATRSADWERFLREALGFVYEPVESDDLSIWQGFLARKYLDTGAMARAWSLAPDDVASAFGNVPLPSQMPAGGPRLHDWIRFVSQVLPTHRNAHRFTVLVPVALDDDVETQRRRLAIATRVTSLERPAHTLFDVRLYWAMLRVGEARLGLDTVLGAGSRFTAIVLGQGALATGYLSRPLRAHAPPPRIPLPSEHPLAPSRVPHD